MPEIGTPNGSIAAEPEPAGLGAWVYGIFVGAAASSGLFLYLLSQSLQPALASAGLPGIWLDICLLVGGLAGLVASPLPTEPVVTRRSRGGKLTQRKNRARLDFPFFDDVKRHVEIAFGDIADRRDVDVIEPRRTTHPIDAVTPYTDKRQPPLPVPSSPGQRHSRPQPARG